MKGARRTRKSRQQAGFADLMAPPHPTTSLRGVVTGVSRAQPSVSTSNPTTPNPSTPDPTTPPPLDEDWGALLQTTPKRKMSPQKPIVATTPNSSPSMKPSPTTTERHIFSPKPANTASPSTPVPAFLSGWDGADGWGDDPSLDDSDQDIQEDPWGVWPESDDLLPSRPELTSDPVSADRPDPPNSVQQPSQHLQLTTPSTTNMLGEPSAVAPNTPPVPRVEENLPLQQNESPQLTTSGELHSETTGTEGLQEEADEHRRAPADEGGATCLCPSDERSPQSLTNEIFSEEEPLRPAVLGVPEQQPEEPPHRETVSVEDTSDPRLELDSSGWNEAHVAEVKEDAAVFPISHPEDTQSRQSTTTEETKRHLEVQTEQELLSDNVGEQVETRMQTDAEDDGMGLKEVGGTNAEVWSDPVASATSTVVTSDNHDVSPSAPVLTDSSGFGETGKEVPVDGGRWGWGEGDNAPGSNINDNEDTRTNNITNASVKPNDFVSESLKENSRATYSASDDRSREEMVKDEKPHSAELHESKEESNNADIFSSSQPAAAPEDSWDFDEDSRETVTDDWEWGVQTEHRDIEFAVDSSANNANIPPNVSAEDPLVQGSAHLSHHSQRQAEQQSRAVQGPHEEDGMTVKGGTAAKLIDHKLHSVNSGGDDPLMAASMSLDPDCANILGAQQSEGTTLEPENSFSVAGDSARKEHVRRCVTLDHEPATDEHSRLPNEEGLPNSDSFGRTKSEDDAWGIEVRSTDVDVSSTVAGTDVPSVVAPSSVDEAEWDADRNELRFSPPHAADITQSKEKLNSAAPDGIPTCLWGAHDHTSQTDRSWTNPDVLWSSPPADSQSPLVAETPSGTVDQRAPAEAESPSYETILLRDSNAVDTTTLGTVEEPSFRTVKDSSSSEITPSYPTIEPAMFQHFPGNHAGVFPVTKTKLNKQTEVHAAEEPARLGSVEVRNTSDVPWVTPSDGQHGTQSVPQERRSAVSNITSSFSTTNANGKNSNSYWTERLDQSRTRNPDGSHGMSHTASTDFSRTKSAETEIETSLAAGGRPEVPRDSMPEKGVVNIPLNTKLEASNEPIKQSSAFIAGASDAASGPTSNLEAHSFPDPASQLDPAHEAKYRTNRNETMNLASPAVDASDFFHSLERGSGATETRAQNGLISNEGSRSSEITQSFRWPSEGFAIEDGDGSNYFASFQDGQNIRNSTNMRTDRSHEHDSVSKQTNMELLGVDNNPISVYNQCAPRLTSSPARDVVAEVVSEGILPPLAQPPSDVQQANVSTTEAIPDDTAIYYPFSVSHEDTTLEQTKDSGEAFDWNFGAPESVRDAQGSLPSISEEPQSDTGPSARSPQTDVSKETAAGQNAVQTKTVKEEDSNLSSTLKLPQDAQANHAVEARGHFDKDFAGRKLTAPEDERRPVSSHWEARRIEHDVEEFGAGRHQKVESSQDDMTLPVSDPQQSLDDDFGLERYAPRQVLSAESGSGVPTEVPPSSDGREPLDTSGTNENIINVPFAAASSGISHSDSPVPEKDPMPVPYQSVQPESSSQFEADVPEAPLPRPTSMSGNYRDMGPHQRGTEGLSPSDADGGLLGPKNIHADHLTRSRLPPSASQDLELHRERPQAAIPRAIKPRGDNLSESLVSYQGDHVGDRTSALAYAPAQKESYQKISQEAGSESAESKQHSLSVYSTEVNPSILSGVKRSELSSPYVTQAAYASETGPARSPGGDDVPPPKDTFTDRQGSYCIAEEFSLGYSVPPPPQQAAFPPPEIHSNQEVFPAESMVDPSTFSYPYSILDTETSGDESYRPQRPLVSWGFGGKLVTVIPPRAYDGMHTETKVSSTVHIYDLTAMSQDGSNDDWAAASEAVSPLSLPVRSPDLLSYADMCDRLSKLSVGLTGSESEGRAAMWRILALLCRQGTSDWRVNASTSLCGPFSVPMFGRNNGSALISGKSTFSFPLRETELISPTSEPEKNEAAAEVERLLAVGNGIEAIRVAREAGLWSIALVLAATIDKSVYTRVVSEFANSTLQDGSALQTMCLSTAEDESEVLRKATSSSGLKEWRKTVGMLLATRRVSPNTGEGHHARFLRLIDRIGDALISQRNDVLAGHVCFLLSGRLGSLDSSNIPLLGADPKKPAGRPRSMGSPAAALQSLVFEAVANTQNGVTFAHILPFRLLLAEEICSVGRTDVALAHCESISSAVRDVFESGNRDTSSKFFTLPFLSRLESLEQRLHVHLGLQGSQAKKGGGLSSLGKSLSSVFTRSSTAGSKGGQTTRESVERSAPFVGPQRTPPLQPVCFTSASPQTPAFTSACSQTPAYTSASPQTPAYTSASPQTPAVSSLNIPRTATESQWTPKFEPSRLHPLPVDKSSKGAQPEAQSGDMRGNERWNSLVSKTIGFIAPAEGDLSPPLKARGDQSFPLHAQPTPLGLGTGTGRRAPSQDVHHMRSSSVGDVPVMQGHGPIAQGHGQAAFSHHVLQASPQDPRRNPLADGGGSVNQATFNGMPVQKTTFTESVAIATHRRSASDMTFESQTSEKKPPRPPKKSPGLPSGTELQPKKQNAPVVKGWRSRLSEKIRAAFSGPPRAHMGVENKFRYDKERGRWIMEGEDPNDEDDTPPPPPADDAMTGEKQKVPFSQSYESLPNPDLSDQLMPHYNGANSEGTDGLLGGGAGADNFRRYNNAQFGYNSSTEKVNSRDTGSESSVASAASAPVPYSSQPGISMSSNSGNKFRAHPGRLSGRRAYVDTFNKGTPMPSIPASLARASRPGIPSVPVPGSSNGNGYRIFTPSPAVSYELNDSNERGRDVSQGASNSIAESSDQTYQLHQETQANNMQQPSDSFGYGLSEPAPMPSVEQCQANTRNENQPRLMA